MQLHADNKKYADWDIESTASTIGHRFPNSHVWTVKASQMISRTFNIYSNFVKWKELPSGAVEPVHGSGQRSWHHLCYLIRNAVNRMNVIMNEECRLDRCLAQEQNSCTETFDANLPAILVGFSKGCVVLNQLAYDMSERTDDAASVEEFIQLVSKIYWLDGGHGGRSDTWITQENILACLSRFEIESHVTPYQVKDATRPWLGHEHDQFIRGLQVQKTKLKHVLHFGDQKRSLLNHFKVLHEF